MHINGYEINLSEEELDDILSNQTRNIELIGPDFAAYKSLFEDDKKALSHLIRAAKIIDEVAFIQDHPLNLLLKDGLEEASKTSEYAQKAYQLFQNFHGVSGFNGICPEPIEIFKNVQPYKGKNFYPTDLSVCEFHQILIHMFEVGEVEDIKKILSSRTMVRRAKSGLRAIDYTSFFAPQFSQIANELELAAYHTTKEDLKEYLSWQAQAFLQNNEEMDSLADKHWALLQSGNIEFTISRENYEDELTGTVFENEVLKTLIEQHNIEVNSKDTLGCRIGLINHEGTNLILKSKDTLPFLAELMPYRDQYAQNIKTDNNQTMVDVDLMVLSGDYAFARGAITTAQNLPNDDKLSVKTGGGRRNVYHRQVRFSSDKERAQKLLDALVDEQFHAYFKEEALHFFVIGHENGHSLGPDSTYKSALGVYSHILEENKADVISAAFMEDIVKTFHTYTFEELKQIYTTWIVSLFLKAKPVFSKPHRMAELIEFNYLLAHNAISFNGENKLKIDFSLVSKTMKSLLREIIEVQLSKSPERAKAFISKWGQWSDVSEHIANVQKSLGVKPYIKIITKF